MTNPVNVLTPLGWPRIETPLPQPLLKITCNCGGGSKQEEEHETRRTLLSLVTFTVSPATRLTTTELEAEASSEGEVACTPIKTSTSFFTSDAHITDRKLACSQSECKNTCTDLRECEYFTSNHLKTDTEVVDTRNASCKLSKLGRVEISNIRQNVLEDDCFGSTCWRLRRLLVCRERYLTRSTLTWQVYKSTTLWRHIKANQRASENRASPSILLLSWEMWWPISTTCFWSASNSSSVTACNHGRTTHVVC